MFDRIFSSGTDDAVDLVDVGLGAAVKLGPDFVAPREMFEPVLNMGQVQAGGIGQQHELEEGEPAQRADMHDRLERLGELGERVGSPSPLKATCRSCSNSSGSVAIPGPFPQPAAAHEGQRLLQFRRHRLHVQRLRGAVRRSGALRNKHIGNCSSCRGTG